MIPKVIHWCWFGRGTKSERVKRCLASWHKYLPDYEIKEWNEDNFDIHINKYVEQAYEAKKWAFVSDYVRVYALYHEGGVYMDSDVEVLKPLDPFLSLTAFSGRESANGSLTGTMGSVKGGRWVKDLLDDYRDRSFINSDGTYNWVTNVEYCDKVLKPMGLTLVDEEFEIPGYVKIFKQEVFCPKSWRNGEYHVTENSYTIHHFTSTYNPPWLTKRKRLLNWIRGHLGYYAWRVADLLFENPICLVRRISGALSRIIRAN